MGLYTTCDEKSCRRRKKKRRSYWRWSLAQVKRVLATNSFLEKRSDSGMHVGLSGEKGNARQQVLMITLCSCAVSFRRAVSASGEARWLLQAAESWYYAQWCREHEEEQEGFLLWRRLLAFFFKPEHFPHTNGKRSSAEGTTFIHCHGFFEFASDSLTWHERTRNVSRCLSVPGFDLFSCFRPTEFQTRHVSAEEENIDQRTPISPIISNPHKPNFVQQ